MNSIMKNSFNHHHLKVSDLTVIAIMMALSFVLGKIGFHSTYLVITPAFIVTGILAYLYGPIWLSVILGISDILFTFIGGELYIPGFTVSAVISGFIYGLLLYRDDKFRVSRIIIAQVLVSLFVHLFLNTLWLTLYNGIDWHVIIVSRIIKEAIVAPIQILVFVFIFKLPIIQKIIKEHWN
ncbi:folate family ECF transporter S component [Apilactobacillus apisilvae]|uniref:Folate family ECF transporter S component n=1 Tax=Apilactobacillus apisilvae TaxID=2923364 RepID=A0ABY4PHQ7_9LACO|nr:folate family ECF transporter S component [Apilactobacillus apisilvae]UQS85376.1 folate family ECF transporter S component [Apilactobacillus apisilvae]